MQYSLARAIYRNASIYLLDDPLSAVDARIGGHLFKEVIGCKGRLARMNATRVLVTHQVHFLKEADIIVIIDQGRIVGQGNYDALARSDNEFAQMLKQLPGDIVEDELFTEDGLMPDRSFGRKSLNRNRTFRMSSRSVSLNLVSILYRFRLQVQVWL